MGHNIYAWPHGRPLNNKQAVELRLNERQGFKTKLYEVLDAPASYNQKRSGSGDILIVPVAKLAAIYSNGRKLAKLYKNEKEWLRSVIEASPADTTVTIQFE